ncbi:MAG: EVE domain-containing protein [Gammaproteobacteria bacterium]|nr:EVE domain-containing protein [Gammaproteobacteria bacterium]
MNYWLLKSEPDVFGIDHLIKMPRKTEHWDGVRNYQARNFMRDSMKKGDLAFFYHSNCKEPGIVGVVRIVREAYPDHTAFDPKCKYYDPNSEPAKPRWFMVDVKYDRRLKRPISLKELKQQTTLKSMKLLQRGNRLSVMPVEKSDWDHILKLETACC